MTNCPSCGTPITGGFCSQCGMSLAPAAPTSDQPVEPQAQHPGPPPPYEQPGGGKRRFIAIMAGLIVAIVIIAAAFLILSGGLGGDEEGTCHVIYYKDGYREEYKYPHTKSECDQYCVEAADTQYNDCYWDDE